MEVLRGLVEQFDASNVVSDEHSRAWSFMDSLTEDFVQAKNGDRAAFDRLRTALEQPLIRFIRRLIGTDHMVEDVLQDAFVALYMNMERIDPVENVRPFLYRIVRNLCYDELRRRGRYETVEWKHDQGDLAPPPGRHSIPIPERLHWCVVCQGVESAIDRLPENQRQAMLLYCEEKLSYAQIAQALGVSIGTVKSRLYYARANLVRILGLELLEGLGLEKTDDGGDEA